MSSQNIRDDLVLIDIIITVRKTNGEGNGSISLNCQMGNDLLTFFLSSQRALVGEG